MDSKKSAARAAKDVRASTTSARNTERSQILSKRPSAPPTELSAKKRASLPPPVADNDNAPRGKTLSSVPSKPPVAAVPSKPPSGLPKAPVPNIPRGRLPTGSLHTEARTPAQADAIKQRLTMLVNTQQKLTEMRRSHQKHFYEIGELLHRVRDQRLFEVKGYSSFESFIEREVNLGQQFCLHAVRIFETFLPAAVQQHGYTRLAAAIDALDHHTSAPVAAAGNETLRMARSPIPPHKL